MKNSIYNNKWLLLIIFIAVIVRIVYFFNVKPWESSFLESQMSYNDSRSYHEFAIRILENKDIPKNIGHDTYRTPVFPLVIFLLYFIFGIKPYFVIILNFILNIISIYYVYLLTNELFNKKLISLLSSFLYAFEPNLIKLNSEFGTEILHATLLIFSIYYLVKGFNNRKYSFFVISGFLFGLTALTRPISLYFYIICIIAILLYKDLLITKRIKFALVFVLVYFITLVPWMLRNYVEYGYFSTNAVQGFQLLYLAGVTKSYVTGMDVDSVHKEFNNLLINRCNEKSISNYFEVDKQREIIALDYLSKNFNSYIYLHVKGMAKYFLSPLGNSKYSRANQIVIGLYLIFIYLMFLIGSYYLSRDKKYFALLFLLILILYFCFLTGIIGISRYRAPTSAFYLIISSYGIYYLIFNIRNKNT